MDGCLTLTENLEFVRSRKTFGGYRVFWGIKAKEGRGGGYFDIYPY
jgi:hypothetical protein